MPRKLSRAIGVDDDSSGVLPLLGLREIASGLGVLAADNPSTGVRARVAGDVLDLALLGTALAVPSRERTRLAAATLAVAGVTALDVVCAAKLTSSRTSKRPTHLRTSVAINRPAEQLYAVWRNLPSIPSVMRHIAVVQETGDGRSRWIATGPADLKLEWTAEITQDLPNQRLGWRSLPDADVQTEASVEFKPMPAGRGTIVTLDIGYEPRGVSSAVISKLFGKAIEQQIENDLRRWKQLMETGEVATTEGQPHGKRSAISRHLP
jgi:uncharacterized membrane protein